MAGDEGFIAAFVDHPADRVVDADRLEHADAALVAALVALVAAARTTDERALVNAEQRAHRLVGGYLLAANRAKPPHQPLGDDRAQGGGEQERLDLHVAHPGDRADCIVGVDGREHEVAGERRLHRDLRRLAVADLADHDHVRVLTQNGAQAGCEAQADLGIHLRLAHALDRIFDRIFDGEDVAAAVVQRAQARIKRGRLAAAGRAGDEDDAIGLMQRAAEHRVGHAGEPEHIEGNACILLVEDTHDNALPRPARQGRDTHVEHLAAQR